MLKLYLKELFEAAQQGDATEESYYFSVKNLLDRFADSTGKKNIQITALPKKTEAGNPDFRVWDGKQHIIGYIEAKAPSIKDLDKIEETEQLQRYLHTFPNLILTNFFEYRLYRDGVLTDKTFIARPFIIDKIKTIPPVENQEDFIKLLDKFFSFSLPAIYNSKSLAKELAKRTSFLRDEIIYYELDVKKGIESKTLNGFYNAFKQFLIGGLAKKEFADLYSQTITYGLFAARTRVNDGFNRKLAYALIPNTIGILREIFEFISLGNLPQAMEWIIDDISEILAIADVNNILHQYYSEGKGKDPVVHFYETFLSEYDPKTREKRGVYYTPEPVVSFIVRSLNSILKEHFDRTDGFASDSVTVLDPAAGTLTFLAETSKIAVEEFTAKYGDGGVADFIKEHILKKFYGFELMMAPYAIGHIKMSFLLEELGYRLRQNDRFKLYLTNTLEMENLAQTELPGISSLSEESHLAGDIKKEKPILVILGNPPYSGHSANLSEKILKSYRNGREVRTKIKTWIGKCIDDYKYVDGKPLGEKNPKWLQDDYVKFIRFAQWKIEQAGEGVVGFITNHSYLDNPTFRGMRQSLMQSFNEMYILDLHGNSLKREKCPDGSKDENVFDIKQGVAISIFVKLKDDKKKCKVYHSELWGLRNIKYAELRSNDIKTNKWKRIYPKSKHYLFTPRDTKLLESYEKYPVINKIFPINNICIVTSRDEFIIDTDKSKLKNRIKMFLNEQYSDEVIKQTFNINDTENWKLKTARNELKKVVNWEKYIIKILYRPFDIRWILYHDIMIERSRKEIMRHMLIDNLGILSVRQVAEGIFNHAFITQGIVESRITLSNKGIAYLFPQYLYNDLYNDEIFSNKDKILKKDLNVNNKYLKLFKKAYTQKSNLNYFYYIYAILYSNIYRNKYAEFLKIDFPRIPFTTDYTLFKAIAGYGKKLVDCHLLKSSGRSKQLSKFVEKGSNKIEKIKYIEKDEKIYINDKQYFSKIENNIWNYQIGGYQVCDKWLKSRKNQKLSLEDIKHYCKIVTAIKETIMIQIQIDELYPKVEKDTIDFEL
ncbi:MAG: N-6 DNA methylase [candidate division Zixibacteria bacterium]|nr:N-6 DNA methylase [candidate division Zixibacteria bacterium]